MKFFINFYYLSIKFAKISHKQKKINKIHSMRIFMRIFYFEVLIN